jgi:hypothetical protein
MLTSIFKTPSFIPLDFYPPKTDLEELFNSFLDLKKNGISIGDLFSYFGPINHRTFMFAQFTGYAKTRTLLTDKLILGWSNDFVRRIEQYTESSDTITITKSDKPIISAYGRRFNTSVSRYFNFLFLSLVSEKYGFPIYYFDGFVEDSKTKKIILDLPGRVPVTIPGIYRYEEINKSIFNLSLSYLDWVKLTEFPMRDLLMRYDERTFFEYCNSKIVTFLEMSDFLYNE